MTPAVWLIIIAVAGVGGPSVTQIPFETVAACVAAADTLKAQKPSWAEANTMMVCAPTGSVGK
jgi:hypothetical protein